MKGRVQITSLAMSMLVSIACNPSDSNEVASWTAAIDLINGDQLNGTVYNGMNFNGMNFNGMNFNGMNFNGMNFNGMNFNGTNLDTGLTVNVPVTSLVGMTGYGKLSNGSQVKIRIASANHDNQWNVDWYYPELSLDNGASWGPLCAGGVGAVPVAELWDNTGKEAAPPDWTGFTLACDNAAIAKCVKWGYNPDAMRDECVSAGNCTSRSLKYWHQACTRMVRADYCGDGVAHTRNSTLIDVYDNLGIQSRSGSFGAGMVEADWAPDGAHCIRKTRFTNATGLFNDLSYINSHKDGGGTVDCSARLAQNEANCGGDPNTTDNTTYVKTLSTSVTWSSRHLLRNDSNTVD